jgi:hypothetical protein
MELALKQVWVDRTLLADSMARRRAGSLHAGAIDHFFHYQGARQAQLWLNVHREHAPLFSDAAFTQIFADLFARVVPEIHAPRVCVVALGPGAGSKEGLLLEALVGAGIGVRYVPIDASVDLALLSAQAAPAGVDSIEPVAADLSIVSRLRPWLEQRAGDEPWIFTAFGVAPNLAPSELFAPLARAMRPGDRLLLSANLAGTQEAPDAYRRACEAILPQYQNAATLAWLGAVLHDWGLSERLTPPAFSIGTVDGIDGFIASSVWREDETFTWEGAEFRARRGDTLRVFFSLRYTPGRLARALEPFGFVLGDRCITADAQEGVWSVERR